MKVGLGLPDNDAWYMLETIANKNNVGYKQFVRELSPFPLLDYLIIFSFYFFDLWWHIDPLFP